MDLRRILVPLDGSELAERVLPLAEQLALRAGAQLVLARAPLAKVFSGMDAIDEGDGEAAALAEAEAYLQAVIQRLWGRGLRFDIATPLSPREDQGVLLDQVARATFPFRQLADTLREAAEAIVREAEARQVDLIVMATHGRSRLERWVHGSAALEVLRRATTPVLLVRANVPNTLPDAEPPRILVPLDGTALSETALVPATALVRLFGGSLVLVRAIPALRRSVAAWLAGPLVGDPIEHAAMQGAAESYLEGIQARLAEEGIATEAVVVEGDAASAIAEATTEQRCALVAMATHARTGLAQLASEHVAETIMITAPSPVLVVRPADTVEEERLMATADVAEEPVAASPVGAAAAPILVRLSLEECNLLQTALQTLQQTSGRDAHLGEPIQHVMAKLTQALAAVAHGETTLRDAPHSVEPLAGSDAAPSPR